MRKLLYLIPMYGFIVYCDKNNDINIMDTSMNTIKSICINGILSILFMLYGFGSALSILLLILKITQ